MIKMKNLLFVLLLPLWSMAGTPKPVKITGHLQFEKPIEMVFLSYRGIDGSVKDSSKAVNGNFTFNGKLEEPTMATMYVRFPAGASGRPEYQGFQFFMEPGNIQINAKDSMQLAKVTGSKSQQVFESYSELQKPYNEKEKGLYQQYQSLRASGDTAGMKKIEQEDDQLNKDRNENVNLKYIHENPNSPIVMYVLNEYAGYDIDLNKIEPLFNSLPANVRELPSGIAFKKKLEAVRKTSVGATAMNFTQSDTLGKPVSLADFRGKYVLLDFWASWCGPCRAENPNVVKAFNEYKDKNFTVLGVSLDQPGKKEAWLNAIHHDGLTWTHVSDLKFWDNAVAKQYGIQAIPQNFLIDPAGKIIAKNIRGEELNEKLEEVLK